MTVIFLDIDGVLNQLQGNFFLDVACVNNLHDLCHNLNASIVLITSWKKGFCRNKNMCSKQICNLIDLLGDASIINRTRDCKSRKEEVLLYLKEHPEVTRYVILDDDFEEEIKGLYQVNYKTGLTKSDIKKIRKYVVTV